jgi:hypothetical protein
MLKSRSAAILIFLIFLVQNTISGQTEIKRQQHNSQWQLSFYWRRYHSYSQQKNDLPMKAGYPVLTAKAPTVGIGYKILKQEASHKINLTVNIPASLESDNGRGDNYLLLKDESNYFRCALNYRFNMPLWQWKQFEFKHAFLSGALYESRNITYISGSQEKTRDLNLYFGPGLQLLFNVTEMLDLEGVFDGRFYLPYFNYGKLNNTRVDGTTEYRAFYYQTIFKIGLAYKIPNQGIIKLGIKKNDLVGFANRKAILHVENLVHFKLDRLFNFYLSYQF